MPGLILEGGTFRPVFSCGVMDALLEHGLMFDYVIGVSAGITNGVSYVSRQKGRNIDILRRYRNDPRYMGYANYLKCGSMFGLDFIYDEIPNRLSPFDWEAYLAYPGRVRVGVTNALTGQPEYLDGRALDEKCTMLRATCAIPFFSRRSRSAARHITTAACPTRSRSARRSRTAAKKTSSCSPAQRTTVKR